MDEDLDMLNNSSDTIIFPVNDKSTKQGGEESLINSIVNKYVSKSNNTPPQTYITTIIELSDEESNDIPLIKKLKSSTDVRNEILSPSSSSQDEDTNNDNNVLQMLSEKYKPQLNDKERQISCDDIDELKPLTKKEIKLLQQQQKSEERKRKKEEAEKEKCLKQATAAASKNIKPGECMKFISVHLDNDVVNADYGNEIITALQAADVNYTIQSQIFPNTISWTRKTQSPLIDDDGKLTLSSQESDTDDILLIMKCQEFIEHIHNNSLVTHIQSLKSVLLNKRITLIILNLQNYLKFQKNQKQREFAAAISEDSNQRQPKKNNLYQNLPNVSMKNIEFALTELQILCKCSHRLLKNSSEVAITVTQFTKSLAEIPYKLKKHEKLQQLEWFAAGDNRDCVRVDKNGNGIQRLWKQMLTTFPLVNLEIAEAIATMYPTMTSLIMAYEDCPMEKPELLLQDIPIRRAAGPLSSTRRLGPELSKKLYYFFTSMDGDFSL